MRWMAKEDLDEAVAASPVQDRQIAQMIPLISGPVVSQRHRSEEEVKKVEAEKDSHEGRSQEAEKKKKDQTGMLAAAAVTQAPVEERVSMLLKMQPNER